MVKIFVIMFSLVIGFILPISFVSAATVLSDYKYAWSDRVGYINFDNLTISASAISGYAWSENGGWINFSPSMGGVSNDGLGNLSGSAWGENLGWINFDNVSISSDTGRFSGTASGDLIGILTFDCPNYCDVRTDWRPFCTSWTYSSWGSCLSGQQFRTVLSSLPAGCAGGNPVLSQSCISGGNAPLIPSSVGSGNVDKIVGMNQVGEIGIINNLGINYLSYINSDIGFSSVVSKTKALEEHRLIIKNIDLSSKIVEIIIMSTSQKISLNLGQSALVDLDGDKKNDLEIKFADLLVNRVELTIKSLFNASVVDAEKKPVAPVVIVPPVKAPVVKNTVAKVKHVFKKNLATGTINNDVKELQKFLNTHGFVLAKSGPGSPGQETNKFGAFTRYALIQFQKAKKIFPALGYFGPLTRKIMNAMK